MHTAMCTHAQICVCLQLWTTDLRLNPRNDPAETEFTHSGEAWAPAPLNPWGKCPLNLWALLTCQPLGHLPCRPALVFSTSDKAINTLPWPRTIHFHRTRTLLQPSHWANSTFWTGKRRRNSEFSHSRSLLQAIHHLTAWVSPYHVL